MRDLDGSRMRTRVKGRDVLLKRLRALLIAGHRFGRLRAATADEQRFAGVLVAGLEMVLREVEPPLARASLPTAVDGIVNGRIGPAEPCGAPSDVRSGVRGTVTPGNIGGFYE